MKRIVIVCFSLLICFTATSQGLFGILTEKYAGTEGFSATNLTRDMFDIYLRKKQVDTRSPVYETLQKMDNILVVSLNELPLGKEAVKTPGITSEIHKTVLNYYKSQSFTLFKTENRYGEDIKVFLKKNGEKITALSLVSATASRLTLVELNGDIDLANVTGLNTTLNIKGLESLNKIEGQDVYTYGPYHFNYDNAFNWEEQQNFRHLGEEMKKLNNEKVEQLRQKDLILNEKQREFAEQQREMAEKYREMAAQYRRQPIFLSMPGDTNMVYYINGKKVSAKEIKNINADQIESIVVTKPDKDHPGKKGEMRIKTRE